MSIFLVRHANAADVCRGLRGELQDLVTERTDEQNALHTSDCSGGAKSGCIKIIAGLTKQIGVVQKELTQDNCPPDSTPAPTPTDICCGYSVARHPRMTADVDPDGKSDVVAFGNDGVWIARSTGAGGFSKPTYALNNFGNNQSWSVAKHVRLLGDVTGDKRPDIVGFGDAGVWLAVAKPNSLFGPAALAVQNFGVNQGWDSAKHVRTLADINGDGKADIVAFGDAGVWTALSTGTGFSAPAFVLADFGYNQGWRVGIHERLLADVNGDGRADIVAFGDDGVWLALAGNSGAFGPAKLVIQNFGAKQGWSAAKHVRMLADVNGDGKADIVAFGDDGVWTALSTGTGFAAPTFVLANFGHNQGWRVGKHVRLSADVNRDGHADIVAFGDDGVWLTLGNGRGGFGPATFVVQNFGVNQGWDSAKHVRLLADVNGDHKPDIVAFGDDGVWTALSTGTGFSTPKFVLADFAYGGQLDVVLSKDGTDDNDFPRNPVWRQPQPNVCGVCPCGEDHTTPSDWNATAGCSIQSLHANSHTGIGSASPAGIICAAGGATGLNGLMNWFPAEYEGALEWGGHSNSVYDDDDYYMSVTRNDAALETPGRTGVHFEFDSEETVDNWDNTNTWWDDFHHNAVDNNDAGAAAYVNGKQAIVIGMVSLDLEHDDHHSELHPAYAVFVRLPGPTATREKVAFFVRNWGNQGYCGANAEPIPQNLISVRLRHTVGAGFSLAQNVWVYGDDAHERNAQIWTYRKVSDGLLLSFSLRNASKQCGFVGDLNIDWGSPNAVPGGLQTRAPAVAKQIDEDGDMALKSRYAKLDPAGRLMLFKGITNLGAHKATVRKPASAGDLTRPVHVVRVGITFKPSTKLQSVADEEQKSQRAKQHQFVLTFLKSARHQIGRTPKHAIGRWVIASNPPCGLRSRRRGSVLSTTQVEARRSAALCPQMS